MSLARAAAACAALALAIEPIGRPARAMEDVSFPVTDSVRLTGRLCRPEGSGRFPAAVLMHGCAGLSSPGNDGLRAVEALLCGSGYVTRDVSMKIYPGAMHAFDSVDPEAARDSQKQLLALFDRVLKKE